MLILDTDVLSTFEHKSPKTQTLLARLERSNERVVTTIVNCEEQLRGWIAALGRSNTIAGQIDAYRRLRSLLESLRNREVLDFDEVAAVKFQELKKAKVRIGTMDLKIAAIALAHDATLLTGNVKDFKQVPDLKFTDWEQL